MKLKHALLALPVAGTILAMTPQAAFASYNRSAAAQYADTYWNNYNTNYPSFYSTGGDCTNFVSQALYAGGEPMVNSNGSTTDDTNWFCYGTTTYSHSWTVVSDLRNYLLYEPGHTGVDEGTTGPTGMSNPYANNWGSPTTVGDLCSYNWTGGQGSGYSHFTIIVGSGTDPNSGDSGTLVDSHTSNRYHAIWTLEPYNSDWFSTTIDVIHVS